MGKNIQKHTKVKKNPIKVTYISNPKMIKANASEFRAIVQQFTGRNTHVGDFSGDDIQGVRIYLKENRIPRDEDFRVSNNSSFSNHSSLLELHHQDFIFRNGISDPTVRAQWKGRHSRG
ncbi:hypothetical protein ACFE04_022509 [Oxalis oulophora]